MRCGAGVNGGDGPRGGFCVVAGVLDVAREGEGDRLLK